MSVKSWVIVVGYGVEGRPVFLRTNADDHTTPVLAEATCFYRREARSLARTLPQGHAYSINEIKQLPQGTE